MFQNVKKVCVTHTHLECHVLIEWPLSSLFQISFLVDRKSAGRVDILSPDDGSMISSLVGESEFSQFGYSLEEATIVIESVPRRVLIVGSPTFTYDSGMIDSTKFL